MKLKYSYLVIYAFQSGIGSTTVNRNVKIDTISQFNEFQEFVRKSNPTLEKLFITNLMVFENQ